MELARTRQTGREHTEATLGYAAGTRARRRAMLLTRAGLAMVLLSGCGELADGTYTGEQLHSIHGLVRAGAVPSLDADVRVAVLWVDADVEQGITAIPFSSNVATEVGVSGGFPTSFDLDFLDVPDASVMNASNGPDAYAVGIVVAYLDCNGNGRFDLDWRQGTKSPDDCSGLSPGAATDLLVGVDAERAVLYTTTPLAPGSDWGARFHASLAVPAGYANAHLVDRNSECLVNSFGEVTSCTCAPGVGGGTTLTCEGQTACAEMLGAGYACGAWNVGVCIPEGASRRCSIDDKEMVVDGSGSMTFELELVRPREISVVGTSSVAFGL